MPCPRAVLEDGTTQPGRWQSLWGGRRVGDRVSAGLSMSFAATLARPRALCHLASGHARQWSQVLTGTSRECGYSDAGAIARFPVEGGRCLEG